MIDTSLFVAAGRDLRSLHKSVTVSAAPPAVFEAWTTAEGLAAFLGVTSNVDLSIGGPYELFFMPESPDGPIGSNDCQVLAYVPDRILAFSWNGPPQFPEERALRTWVVIELEAVGEVSTKLTMTHLGFGSGGHWDDVHAYFDAAWDSVLGALASHFGA